MCEHNKVMARNEFGQVKLEIVEMELGPQPEMVSFYSTMSLQYTAALSQSTKTICTTISSNVNFAGNPKNC